MKSKGKVFVIVGFALLILVMSTGLWLIFENLKDFSDKISYDEERRELLIVGNVINSLYETEATHNLLTFESAEKYIESYDSIRPLIATKIDTLKQLSNDSSRVVMLDSISVLLDLKHENLGDILVLMDSVKKAPSIIRKTTSTYVAPRLNKDISDFLTEKEIFPDFDEEDFAVDTTVLRGERKGLFRRLGDAIVGKQDSTVILRQQPATVIQKEYELILDTVINMVRYSERLNVERQQLFYRQLVDRQSLMSQHNQVLTTKIDNLLKTIEQEEMNRTMELLAERERVLDNSSKTLLYVSLAAHLIALIFGALFIIDANRLKRTRRQLEESNRKISDLLKSREKLMLAVSHDIKSPMGAVLGYIELLEVNQDDQKAKEYREYMRQSGEHILGLVDSMLDLHKVESGTWTEHKVDYNLEEVVRLTIDTFRTLAEQKKLDYVVVTRIPKNLIAFGEPFMVRLIISNLISNAIKYTPQGGVDVKSEFLIDRQLLRLVVADTGIGIDEEHQELVFEEFTQLKAENSDEYIKGSGLGLAITKGLIEEMGGEISLNSKPGRGTTFTVELPLEIAAHEEIEQLDDLSNLSILLVDDDVIQLAMTKEMLKKKGAAVDGESDPLKVISKLRTQHFDYLLIDIQMPQMNGFVLAGEIHKLGLTERGRTRLIALTAQSDLSKETFVNAGFDDFLHKPFTAEQLYRKINSLLQDVETIEPLADQDSFKGVEVLIGMVEDDEATADAILHAFADDAKLLYADLADLPMGDNKESAAYIAHKMLPLFKMMGDDKVVDVLNAVSNKKSVADEHLRTAMKRVKMHCENAEKLISDKKGK